MAYKFQLGEARLSGSLIQEEGAAIGGNAAADTLDFNNVLGNKVFRVDTDGSNRGRIQAYASNGSTVNFQVSNGQVTAASLVIDDDATIGCDSDTDVLTIGDQAATFANNVDVNIAKAGGLQIGGSAVTSNAAELNFNDGVSAGVTTASKTLVAGANKNIGGLNSITGSTITCETALLVGATSISAAEIAFLDSVTAGTAAASKAVVLGANKNIGVITSLTASTITAANLIKMGNAEITEAELEQIDGITAGTAAASKALVLGANKNIGLLHSLSASTLTADTAILTSGKVGTAADQEYINFGTSNQIEFAINNTVEATMTAQGFVVTNGLLVGAGESIDVSSAGALNIGDADANAITIGKSGITTTIAGNLVVQGATTTVESQTVKVKDALMELNVVTGSEARTSNANAGFLLSGSVEDRNVSLQVAADGGRLKVSGSSTIGTGFDIVTGGSYAINGTSVLNATTLGSNVVASSLTSVGALNSGTITSGFGNINNGSSTITTTGLISGGSLDIDDVLIDGSNIGHTDDVNLITLANQSVALANDVDFNVAKAGGLQLAGVAVTSTAAELNLLDGVSGLVQADFTKLAAIDATDSEIDLLDADTAIAAKISLVDGDGFIVEDDDTMKKVTVESIKDYIGAGTRTVTSGSNGATLSKGITFFNDHSVAISASMPTSIADGDEFIIKAGRDCSSARYLEITASGGQTFDATLSKFRLESPNAAITILCVNASNEDFRLI